MPVVDVDSHFEPTLRWLDDVPALKERLPKRYPTDDPRGPGESTAVRKCALFNHPLPNPKWPSIVSVTAVIRG